MSDLEKLRAEIEVCRWKMGETNARIETRLGTSKRPALRIETHVENQIVKPILEALGWNFSTARAEQQFLIQSKPIDFALKSGNRNRDPVIFVEAKKLKSFKTPSGLKGGQKQLFDYLNASKHKGEIKLLLLVDGDKWIFYKPQYQDYPPDKLRFREVSLLDESLEETSKILYEFLNIALVDDGTSNQNVDNAFNAHIDYQEAQRSFPEFMQFVLNNPSPELCDALSNLHKERFNLDLGEDKIQSLMKGYSSSLIKISPKSGASAHSELADTGDTELHPQTKSTVRKSPAPAQKLRVTYRNQQFSDISARDIFEGVIKMIVRDYGIHEVAPLTHFLKTTAEMTRMATYKDPLRRSTWVEIPGTDYYLSANNGTKGNANALKGIRKGLRISDSDFVIEFV